MRLFHVSDQGEIAVFEPRPPPSPDTGVVQNVVWAIDEAHLSSYLLPRDCPRAAFRPGPAITDAERTLFFGELGTGPVVAIERVWQERVERATIFVYELDSKMFTLQDKVAGYYTATSPIEPLGVRKIDDLRSALRERGTELRIVDQLWSLRDSLIESGAEFSLIRMRNARPREA